MIGNLEKKILKLVNNKSINIGKVNELFEAGANPNALEDDMPDKGIDDEIYYATFFSECIFESQEKNPNLYPLLELFIKHGLDVEKYGASIISDFHFIDYIDGDSNIYEMTKLILKSSKNKIDVKQALSGIGTEESYLNCCCDEMPERDEASNELYGLYELIDAYDNDKPYDGFYKLSKIINQKFVNLKLKGDFVEIKADKVSVISKNGCMKTKIEMEEDTLIVADSYAVCINNKDINKFSENEFTTNANKYFKDERILAIKFKHYAINNAQNRLVTIEFTNDKKLVYERNPEENLETIEIK